MKCVARQPKKWAKVSPPFGYCPVFAPKVLFSLRTFPITLFFVAKLLIEGQIKLVPCAWMNSASLGPCDYHRRFPSGVTGLSRKSQRSSMIKSWQQRHMAARRCGSKNQRQPFEGSVMHSLVCMEKACLHKLSLIATWNKAGPTPLAGFLVHTCHIKSLINKI